MPKPGRATEINSICKSHTVQHIAHLRWQWEGKQTLSRTIFLSSVQATPSQDTWMIKPSNGIYTQSEQSYCVKGIQKCSNEEAMLCQSLVVWFAKAILFDVLHTQGDNEKRNNEWNKARQCGKSMEIGVQIGPDGWVTASFASHTNSQARGAAYWRGIWCYYWRGDKRAEAALWWIAISWILTDVFGPNTFIYDRANTVWPFWTSSPEQKGRDRCVITYSYAECWWRLWKGLKWTRIRVWRSCYNNHKRPWTRLAVLVLPVIDGLGLGFYIFVCLNRS
jgi:hypothetical protein